MADQIVRGIAIGLQQQREVIDTQSLARVLGTSVSSASQAENVIKGAELQNYRSLAKRIGALQMTGLIFDVDQAKEAGLDPAIIRRNFISSSPEKSARILESFREAYNERS